jgi:hypothetical protein
VVRRGKRKRDGLCEVAAFCKNHCASGDVPCKREYACTKNKLTVKSVITYEGAAVEGGAMLDFKCGKCRLGNRKANDGVRGDKLYYGVFLLHHASVPYASNCLAGLLVRYTHRSLASSVHSRCTILFFLILSLPVFSFLYLCTLMLASLILSQNLVCIFLY